MAEKKRDWLRTIGIVVVLGALVAYGLLMRSCGINSVLKTTKTDTISRTDTVIREYRVKEDTTVYVKTTIYQPFVIHNTDTIHWIDPVDTAAILKDYRAIRYYSDTQRLERGQVIIQDSLTQNRIKARRLQLTITDTLINSSVVLTPPRRLVGYLDITGMGGRHDFGAGIGFSLKLPSDRAYGVGVSYLWNGKVMYYGRASIPIRIK